MQRLEQVRPETLGQALRIPGLTPAAVAVLATFVGRAGFADGRNRFLSDRLMKNGFRRDWRKRAIDAGPRS